MIDATVASLTLQTVIRGASFSSSNSICECCGSDLSRWNEAKPRSNEYGLYKEATFLETFSGCTVALLCPCAWIPDLFEKEPSLG